MNRHRISAVLLFMGFLICGHSAFALEFKSTDKVLIIAPHPDDEAIGCAGAIQSALSAKAQVKILYLTHGDQNELASLFYLKKPMLTKKDFVQSGFIREKEAVDAMTSLGLKQSDLVFLGYPDRGMLKLWRKYWGSKKPYRNFMTRLNRVAYVTDFSFGSDYRADNVLRDMKKVFNEFKPNIVFTTAPFDRHSDHQAAFLFTHLCVLELQKELPANGIIYHYPVHLKGWPISRTYLPHGAMVEPGVSYPSGQLLWKTHLLSDDQVTIKAGAISKYRSQMSYSKNFLLSFARQNEVYALLPHRKIERAQTAFYPVVFSKGKDGLDIRVDLKEHLDESGVISFDVFAGKPGVHFSLMPKMNFKIFGKQLIVTDSLGKLKSREIDYQFLTNKIEVHLPWKQLGNPRYLFVLIKKQWQIYDVL